MASNALSAQVPTSCQQRAAKRAAYNARQRSYRKRLRARVFERLGDRCANCGTPDDLTVDHTAVHGAGWNRRKMSAHTRNLRYLEELDAGVPLQALCFDCNREDGRNRRHQKGRYADAMDPTNVPEF